MPSLRCLGLLLDLLLQQAEFILKLKKTAGPGLLGKPVYVGRMTAQPDKFLLEHFLFVASTL
jgi:hypothetical protein